MIATTDPMQTAFAEAKTKEIEKSWSVYRTGVRAEAENAMDEDTRKATAGAMVELNIPPAAFNFDVSELRNIAQMEFDLTGFKGKMEKLEAKRGAAQHKVVDLENQLKDAKAALILEDRQASLLRDTAFSLSVRRSKNLRIFGSPEQLADKGKIDQHYFRNSLPF
jgi:hypothetical protein